MPSRITRYAMVTSRTAEDAITRYVSDMIVGRLTHSAYRKFFIVIPRHQEGQERLQRVRRTPGLWERARGVAVTLQLVPLPSGLPLFHTVFVAQGLIFFLDPRKAFLARLPAHPPPFFRFSRLVSLELFPANILLRLFPWLRFPRLRLNILRGSQRVGRGWESWPARLSTTLCRTVFPRILLSHRSPVIRLGVQKSWSSQTCHTYDGKQKIFHMRSLMSQFIQLFAQPQFQAKRWST